MNPRSSIFITGAASGIGRETALLFAQRGWFVGIADTNEAGLAALARQIGSDDCHVSVLDVTDPARYQDRLAAFAARTGGRLQVLFNNAGIVRMGLNESIPLAQQHLMVNININGVLNGVHHALPYLKNTPGAHIVTMCSVSSMYGMPELAVYSATKHAVRALTEAFSLELAHHGIVVADIVVPYVNTPLVHAASLQAYSVARTGVNLEPLQVAELAWKAAHGRRLHWKLHYLTHMLGLLFWLLPCVRRPLIRRLCLSPAWR
ncbi:MAG: SDR family oxidoreductase [Pseudomonadota bacterium]